MSVVANGSFELPFGNDNTIPEPFVYGNWNAHKAWGSIKTPHRVNDPYTGDWSCRIEATSGTASGGWIYQDFTPQQVDPGRGFFFACKVKPIQGHQYMQLLFDYDRGAGEAAGRTTAVFDIGVTHLHCLGQNGTAPNLPKDGQWHEVAWRGLPDLSSDFLIDGLVVASLPPGNVPPYSVATILIGEGTGGSHPMIDDYRWDDVTLDFNPYPFTASPSLRQRQRAL